MSQGMLHALFLHMLNCVLHIIIKKKKKPEERSNLTLKRVGVLGQFGQLDPLVTPL